MDTSQPLWQPSPAQIAASNLTAFMREINRRLGVALPLDGPRTLSGLIVERLEAIPEPGARLRVGSASIEVLQVAENAVRTARLRIHTGGD